jgi:hypothetical protein
MNLLYYFCSMAEVAEQIQSVEQIQGERKENPFVQPPQAKQQEPTETSVTPPSAEETYPLELARAKLGVEKFKASYEAGDEEWRDLLTGTIVGEELQAMYLGLKPVFFTGDTLNTQQEQAILEKHAQDDNAAYSIINDPRAPIIYDPDQVQKIITANPQDFPDYIPNTPIHEYLQKHTTTEIYKGGKSVTPQIMLQTGLLCGFPRNAAAQFAEFSDTRGMMLGGLYNNRERLAPEEQAVLNGYLFGSESGEEPDTVEESTNNINNFRDAHRDDIQVFLEKRFPGMDEGVKQYILKDRFIQLPGFVYASGNPTPEDKASEQRVRDTFEQSGMNTYLQSLKADTPSTT